MVIIYFITSIYYLRSGVVAPLKPKGAVSTAD